jgi:hypothetical protein
VARDAPQGGGRDPRRLGTHREALAEQTHADAEDTISYFFFKVFGDEQLLRQMSLEVLAFSEFLVRYGTDYYLKALLNTVQCSVTLRQK